MKCNAPFGILLVSIFAIALAPAATAGEEHDGRQRRDQDEARRALLEGKTMPLTAILAIVEKRVKGPVIEVELKTQGARLVYLVQVLSKEGHKVDVELDARTGEVLKSRKR